MTKPIIVVKVPCKLLYVIQVKEFLIKCSTSWPYLISEFLVAYITIAYQKYLSNVPYIIKSYYA